jgi:NADPH:quinone reductase-like Zn-dependent oxidoreductase
LWFVNQPDATLLQTLAADIAAGAIRSHVSEVVAFADLPPAIERNRTQSRSGKVVANFAL